MFWPKHWPEYFVYSFLCVQSPSCVFIYGFTTFIPRPFVYDDNSMRMCSRWVEFLPLAFCLINIILGEKWRRWRGVPAHRRKNNMAPGPSGAPPVTRPSGHVFCRLGKVAARSPALLVHLPSYHGCYRALFYAIINTRYSFAVLLQNKHCQALTLLAQVVVKKKSKIK